MGRLQGKIAVITGGNSGIGFATAKAFFNEGAELIIVGRDKKTLDKAIIELAFKSIALQIDVANPSELDSLYLTVKEKFGRIDIGCH